MITFRFCVFGIEIQSNKENTKVKVRLYPTQEQQEFFDKTLILADKWFASSKTCFQCGYVKKDLMLHEREWECPVCNTLHNRDRNAAINLKNLSNSPQELRVEPLENAAILRH